MLVLLSANAQINSYGVLFVERLVFKFSKSRFLLNIATQNHLFFKFNVHFPWPLFQSHWKKKLYNQISSNLQNSTHFYLISFFFMFRYMWVLLFLFSIKGVEWWQFLSIFCSFYTYRDSIFLLYDLLKVSSTFLLVNLHIWIEWKYNIYRNACKDLALVWFGFKEATNLNVIQNVSLFCENFFFSIDWYAYFYRTMFIRQSITHPHHSFILSFILIYLIKFYLKSAGYFIEYMYTFI